MVNRHRLFAPVPRTQSMRVLFFWVLLISIFVANSSSANGAEDVKPPEVTDILVRDSIKRGVEALLRARNADGTWETGANFISNQSFRGAETALCLYALLHVGEAGDDPRLNAHSKELAKAVEFVTALVPESTYTAAFQASALALCPADDPAVKDAAQRARNYLVQSMLPGGGHGYSHAQPPHDATDYDHSNSNYALVGLAALEDAEIAGVDIAPATWQALESMWHRDQLEDGGWNYSPRTPLESNAVMTAAGVASLLLSREFTHGDVSATPRPDKSLESAMIRLASGYDPASENLYYLFTLERIGLAGGFKYINNRDWYRQGAGVITDKQRPDGMWYLDTTSFSSKNVTKNVFTAYALMFLSRGRSPVLFNKLEYSGYWDARPRDAANITAWVAKTFEKPLAWQSVGLKRDQDWLDAPILLITGSRDPKFSAANLAMLRGYIESGGMIFSTADNASDEFTKAMKKYAVALVGDKREMRELESTHPLFNLWAKIATPPKLWGVSNGSREVWIHSPADMGALWQRKSKANKSPFEVMGNLYYYATGKGVIGHRLDTLAVKSGVEPAVRSISLARIKYDGNWNPEPGAWPRMVKLAANFRTTMKVDAVDASALDVAKTPVAHLTGTATFWIDAPGQAALKKFVENGGTLFIDSSGGSRAFGDSVRFALATIFKEHHVEAIPPEMLFAGNGADAVKIDAVEWRKFTRVRDGEAPPDKPRLQGIKIGDRWAVIFSPDDITSGFLGTNTWGIAGYAPDTAQALARDVLLYTQRK